MSTITFNAKEYEIESLSPKAQALITLVQRADEQLTLFSVSKESLLKQLEVELEGPTEAPAKPAPKRAPLTQQQVLEKRAAE